MLVHSHKSFAFEFMAFVLHIVQHFASQDLMQDESLTVSVGLL